MIRWCDKHECGIDEEYGCPRCEEEDSTCLICGEKFHGEGNYLNALCEDCIEDTKHA